MKPTLKMFNQDGVDGGNDETLRQPIYPGGRGVVKINDLISKSNTDAK